MRLKLTDKGLQGLSSAHRLDVFDAELPTFGVRVSPTGARVFFVLYTLRGERRKRRFTIGPYPHWRLKEARDEARRIVGAVAKGGDPQADRMGQRGALTFGALVDLYMERHAKRNKRTWRQDERQIDRYLRPRWKSRTAASIRKRDVLEVLHVVHKAGPIAANRLRVLISRIYTWGAEQDLVEHLPTMGTKPPAKENPGQRVLGEGELGRLYLRCSTGEGLDDAVRALVLTWQRRSEVARMALSEVSGDLWEIPAARMKNKRPHVVPLSPPLLAIVTARIVAGKVAARGRIFGAFDPAALTRHVAALSKAMGGEPFTSRDLRRTCTTLAGKLGISKDDRARVLSHTDRSVTGRHYDRYDYLVEKRAALEKWAEHVLALAEQQRDRAP